MHGLSGSLLSAVFAALTAILATIGLAGIDSHLATAVRTTGGVLFAWALVPLTSSYGSSYGAAFSLARRTLLFLALSGFATGLSRLCYSRALQLGDASEVAPSTNSASSSSSPSPPPFSTNLSPSKPSSAAVSSPPAPASSR